MKTRIIQPQTGHAEAWAGLRHALWPEATAAQHLDEIREVLAAGSPDITTFLAEDSIGDIVGFAEAALRHDYVNGCETSPVLFLEGIYVMPEFRRRGVARLLCDAVAQWGRTKACREFASDALLENADSHRFHAALGFEEAERVVFFRRSL